MPDVAANNAFDRFTLQAQDAARRALGIAEERDHPAIDSAHLLAALMEQPAIAGRLRAVACDPIVLARYVDALLDSIPSRPPGMQPRGPLPITPALKAAIDTAQAASRQLGAAQIDADHLLLGILAETDTSVARVLAEHGPPAARLREIMAAEAPAAAPAREEAVAFAGPNGTLRGMLHLPGVTPGPAVILLHGFTGTHIGADRLFVQAARYLAGRGWAALRVDFFGSGDSDGAFDAYTFQTQRADAAAMLDYAAEQDAIDADRLAIVGISRGGAVAAALAGDDDRVTAAVFWKAAALPARHTAAIDAMRAADHTTGGLRVSQALLDEFATLDPPGDLRGYSGPGLVVHGSADRHVSREEADALLAALGERGTLHVIDGADHGFNHPDWRDELFTVTADWLAGHLPPGE